MAPGLHPSLTTLSEGGKEGDGRRTQYVILIVSKSHRRSEFENSWKKGRRGGEDLSLPDVYNKGTISLAPAGDGHGGVLSAERDRDCEVIDGEWRRSPPFKGSL